MAVFLVKPFVRTYDRIDTFERNIYISPRDALCISFLLTDVAFLRRGVHKRQDAQCAVDKPYLYIHLGAQVACFLVPHWTALVGMDDASQGGVESSHRALRSTARRTTRCAKGLRRGVSAVWRGGEVKEGEGV